MKSMSERMMGYNMVLVHGGSARYKLAMWGVRLGVRMAKYLPWHPGKLGAWTRGRELPQPAVPPSAPGGERTGDRE